MCKFTGALVALFLLAGCSGNAESDEPDTFQVEAKIDVHQFMPSQVGEPCVGFEGYSDITAGADVVIRDDTGRKAALSSLETGEIVRDDVCRFHVSISDVTAEGDIYSIEVAHRGEVSFKKADAGDIHLRIGT